MSSGVIATSELNSGLATRKNYEGFMAGLPTTGIVFQSLPRQSTMANLASALVSGRESVWLVWLDAGVIISTINYWSGSTAAVTPTNQWFTIRNINRQLLAITADDTTAAWTNGFEKILAFASPFRVPTSGFYYVGINVTAATVPSLVGVLYSTGSNIISKPPLSAGFDPTGGLTTPATALATSAAYTSVSLFPYFTFS